MGFRDNKAKGKVKVKGDHPQADEKEIKNLGEFSPKEMIQELDGEIEEYISSRQEWEQRNTRWYKQRYGVRPKRTFPWPGASNISMPTIDKGIKKLAPSFVNLVYGVPRVARFEVDANSGEDSYQVAEYNADLLDNLLKTKMDSTFQKTVQMVDKMLQHGHALMKVSYEYKTRTKEVILDLDKDLTTEQKNMLINNMDKFLTNQKVLSEFFVTALEQKGVVLNLSFKEDREELERNVKKFQSSDDRKYKFKIDIVEGHAPYIQLVNGEDFLIAGDINNLQDSELCAHVMRFTENQLRKMARGGLVDAEVLDEIIQRNYDKPSQNVKRGKRDSTTSLKAVQDQFQGSYAYQYGNSSEPLELREVYYVSSDKDGIPRKYVMLYSPDYMEKPLRHIELDYEDGKWPFVKFETEITNDGWLASRGIPQVLDYLATTRDTMHNQKIDRMTVGNAPMLKYVPGMVSMRNIRYIPGQGVPVKDIKAVEPLVFPNAQNSYVEEERELKAEIEDYLPFVDFSISDPQSGGSKSRTLGEVMAAKQDKADRFTLDARVFLESYNEMLEMIWSRWLQYGPKEIELLIKGQENPVVWKQQYGLRNMKMRPVGNLFNSNPALRITRSNENVAMLENPRASIYLHEYNLYKDWYMARDPETVSKYVKPLDQVMKEQEAELKQNQEAQANQAAAAEKAIEDSRRFELDKLAVENQAKLQQIEAEGRIKVALENLKIKSANKSNGNNGNGSDKKELAVNRR
ncbi:MAG: hypothetical protein HKN39_05225 [Flavobacteriales bacterium]|nr:hypothetical protein [Flavobacteriales bacterium]